MPFELTPILDKMYALYQKPASIERFQEYLDLLSGPDKKDMELPIGGFNPMAKEHILQKLDELKALNAEQRAKQTLESINKETAQLKNKDTFKVVLSLADDLKGGWTNRYASDYQSKFRLNPLVQRKFCTPIFWTSEYYSEQTLENRVKEYCYRTLIWLEHPKPQTLEEHVEQEKKVAEKVRIAEGTACFSQLKAFYETHKASDNYVLIFNFLYGDAATESLGNKGMGIKEPFAGFRFAQALASK